MISFLEFWLAAGFRFSPKRNLTEPDIRDFWEVWHQLSNDRGLVLMDRRIVIPKPLRKKILHCLHSAYQGVYGMKARANDSVYWPGMNASIRNFRANCSICTTIAPSQPREPITMTPSPEWPFQQIVMDIFHVGHVTYLACADIFKRGHHKGHYAYAGPDDAQGAGYKKHGRCTHHTKVGQRKSGITNHSCKTDHQASST